MTEPDPVDDTSEHELPEPVADGDLPPDVEDGEVTDEEGDEP